MNKEQKKIKFTISTLFISLVAVLFFLNTNKLGHLIELFLGNHNLEQIHFFNIISEAFKTAVELFFILLSLSQRNRIFNFIKNKIFRVIFKNTGDEFHLSENKVTAIIIPVSRTEQPEWIINHIKPKYVSLVYTDFPQSKNACKTLINNYKDIKFNLTEQDIDSSKEIIKNPDDPLETKKFVKRQIKHYLDKNIKSQHILVDTTGGKVPMSIGAFQAAEEMNVSTIYIVGKGEKGQIVNPLNEGDGYPIFLSMKGEED